MPDLQSELKKTLSAWEEDAKQTQPDVKPKEQLKMQQAPLTTNTPKPTLKPITSGQKVFDYIAKFPGKTPLEYVPLIEKLGVKRGSITSFISQMLNNRMLNKDLNGKLTPAVTEFRTIKRLPMSVKYTKKAKPKKLVIIKKTVPPSLGISAIATNTAPTPMPTPTIKTTSSWNVDDLLNTLTVTQARALHKALNLMFKE